MNHKAIHDKIIAEAQNRVLEGYSEFHHIVPRCLGGSDNTSNLVRLTAREHYIIHQLLVKIYLHHHKLIHAAHLMTVKGKGHRDRSKNRWYSWLRRKNAVQMSERMKGKTSPHKGKKLTKAHRDNISKATKGKSKAYPPWNKGKKGAQVAWNKGKKGLLTHIDETKQQIRETMTGKIRGPQQIVTCPYCNNAGGISNMKRWHFHNCKQNDTNSCV